MNRDRKTVAFLAVCQLLFLSTLIINVMFSGLVGAALAPDPGLATVPAMLLTLGTAATIVPAAYFMRHAGRRAGFMLGSLAGALGGGVAALAILQESYVLFCVGNALLGVFQGFATYYRFAAADSVSPAFRSRAVSLVLLGGLAAAFGAPPLATHLSEAVPGALYAGSYAGLVALALLSIAVAGRLDLPRLSDPVRGAGVTLWTLLRRPAFAVAVLNGAVAAGLMVFMMAASPLAATGDGHSTHTAGLVMQGHFLGMFAPSLVTGALIARFGTVRIMLFGGVLMVASALVALSGVSAVHYWISLALVGVGWNQMFVGATTLLTDATAPEERAKAQALNEFLTFAVSALGTSVAGWVYYHYGWETIASLAIPPILVTMIVTLWWAARRTPKPQAA